MISGLYSAATAMDAAAIRHESAAENLANAHLPGYRRRIVRQSTFSTLFDKGSTSGNISDRIGTTARQPGAPDIGLDFTRGHLQQTERSLDVALEGDGRSFFVVNGPDGPLYTRNGSFRAAPDGRLVTIDGLPVNGPDSGINIPAETSGDAISIDREGRLSANGVEFGQLETVRFEDLTQLKAVGASLLQAPPGIEPEVIDESILQGFVEGSNVAHMDELVNIMIASRQYEAAQRAMRTIDQSVERHINGN